MSSHDLKVILDKSEVVGFESGGLSMFEYVEPVVAEVCCGIYFGKVVEILGYVDSMIGLDKERWYFTDSIPNHYTGEWKCWFRSFELR